MITYRSAPIWMTVSRFPSIFSALCSYCLCSFYFPKMVAQQCYEDAQQKREYADHDIAHDRGAQDHASVYGRRIRIDRPDDLRQTDIGSKQQYKTKDREDPVRDAARLKRLFFLYSLDPAQYIRKLFFSTAHSQTPFFPAVPAALPVLWQRDYRSAFCSSA